MPLIDTQTGAIEVGHTVRPAFKPHIIEAFIASVRHRASTVFGSSSGGVGSSATELVSQPCLLFAYQPTGAIWGRAPWYVRGRPIGT